MTTTNSHAQRVRQRRLALAEPDAEWSRDEYGRELSAYVTARGRPPQTVTTHPVTAHMLSLTTELVPTAANHARSLVI